MEKLMTYLDDNKNVMTEGEYLELCNDMKEVHNLKKNKEQQQSLINSQLNTQQYYNFTQIFLNNITKHSNIRKLFIDNDNEIMDYISNNSNNDIIESSYILNRYSELLDRIQSRYIENNYNSSDTIYIRLNTIKTSLRIITTELFDRYLIKDKQYMNSIIDESIYRKKLLRKWIM